MNNTPDCPVCGEGFLSEFSEGVERDDNGYKEVVPLLYSVCSECGSEVGLGKHLDENARVMRKFYERADAFHKKKQFNF